MSSNGTIETPVLIIGAGPTGLALAADLGQRGVRALVIEASDVGPGHPRASLVNVRAMEMLRRWGISAAVKKAAPDDLEGGSSIYCTSLNGYVLARLARGSGGNGSVSPEVPLACNQMWLEPILRDLAASQRELRIHQRWQFDSLTQRGDCVLVEVADLAARERRRIAAQIVVDCSGEKSIVRSSIDVDMSEPGVTETRVSIHLRIPHLEQHHRLGSLALVRFVDPGGVFAELEALDGRALYRLSLIGERFRSEAGEIDVADVLRQVIGRIADHNVLSVQRWIVQNRTAKRYGEGRILLAGNAAHSIGGISGLALGTCLGDAFDLGWKIEAMMAGWAMSGLLDTYALERRPVAQRNAARASEMLDPERALRSHSDITLDTMLGRAARKAMEANAQRHGVVLNVDGLVLGVDYGSSPLVAAEDEYLPLQTSVNYCSTTRPGLRAPHAALPGGQSTLDLYGRGFVLLRLGSRAPEPGGIDRAFAHRGIPLAFKTIEDPHISELHERRLVLVRPDGHVAWRGDAVPDDPLRLADRVRGAI